MAGRRPGHQLDAGRSGIQHIANPQNPLSSLDNYVCMGVNIIVDSYTTRSQWETSWPGSGLAHGNINFNLHWGLLLP